MCRSRSSRGPHVVVALVPLGSAPVSQIRPLRLEPSWRITQAQQYLIPSPSQEDLANGPPGNCPNSSRFNLRVNIFVLFFYACLVPVRC